MELLFRGSALIYLEGHNEFLFRERFQMYLSFNPSCALVKMKQLDQWKPASRTLSSG